MRRAAATRRSAASARSRAAAAALHRGPPAAPVAGRLGTTAFRRGAGSAAFIVANLAMGAILAVSVRPSVIVAWITTAAIGAVAPSSALVLPGRPTPRSWSPPARPRRALELGPERPAARPHLRAGGVTAGLIQGAHAFYYGFSALLWRKAGISEARWSAVLGHRGGRGGRLHVGFAEPLAAQARGRRSRWCMGGAAAVCCAGRRSRLRPASCDQSTTLQAPHALTFAATLHGLAAARSSA